MESDAVTNHRIEDGRHTNVIVLQVEIWIVTCVTFIPELRSSIRIEITFGWKNLPTYAGPRRRPPNARPTYLPWTYLPATYLPAYLPYPT